MTLGEIVRLRRKEKGLTIKQLANLCGINNITIHNIETGKFAPRVWTLWEIALALDLDFLEMFLLISRKGKLFKIPNCIIYDIESSRENMEKLFRWYLKEIKIKDQKSEI